MSWAMSRRRECEQCVIFVEGALLAGAGREHVHVHQRSKAGIAELAENQLNHREPATGEHRFPASAEDLHAVLVVPVVQDELQEVEVSRWNRLEEVTTDHVGAFGETP